MRVSELYIFEIAVTGSIQGIPGIRRKEPWSYLFLPTRNNPRLSGEWARAWWQPVVVRSRFRAALWIPCRSGPGSASQQLMVTYDIPYEDKATVSHPLIYPVTSVSLILPDIGLSVDSEFLESAGQRAMQGTSFVEWETTESCRLGKILTFQILGEPDLAALAASQSSQRASPPIPA